MIFVSTTSHDLLSQTHQYQMRDPSPLQRSDDTAMLSMYDMTDDNRPRSRRGDPGLNRTIPPPISDRISRSIRNENDDPNTANAINSLTPVNPGSFSEPSPLTTNNRVNHGFNVNTTCDEPTSDEEEPSSPATLADLYRRDRLPPPYDSSADDDDDEGLDRAMSRAGRMGGPSGVRRNRRKAEPSRIEVLRPRNDAVKDKDVLAPHAQFFIEKDRSIVSIKFDPPV